MKTQFSNHEADRLLFMTQCVNSLLSGKSLFVACAVLASLIEEAKNSQSTFLSNTLPEFFGFRGRFDSGLSDLCLPVGAPAILLCEAELRL